MMTRAAPRRLYGFMDRGHLGVGAVADVVVYGPQKDKAAMFRNPGYVFKDGTLVARDGKVTHYTRGRTLYVRPDYDRKINRRLDAYFDGLYGLPREMFGVSAAAALDEAFFAEVPCRS
jgi:formylmethanofuran dehydrogenase subunit A